MGSRETIIVEFYGIPRHRAGRAELPVVAGTVHEALLAVQRACPALGNLFAADARLSPHYLLSLGGQPFLRDLNAPLQQGDRLVLFSADAGG